MDTAEASTRVDEALRMVNSLVTTLLAGMSEAERDAFRAALLAGDTQ